MSKAITLSKASIYRRKAATCRDLAGCAKSAMDREQLLKEASRLSRVVADDAMRIIRQRGLIERLKSGVEVLELDLEQAKDLLKTMLEDQTQHEQQLVRVQAKLIF